MTDRSDRREITWRQGGSDRVDEVQFDVPVGLRAAQPSARACAFQHFRLITIPTCHYPLTQIAIKPRK